MKQWEIFLIFIQSAYSTESIETVSYLIKMFNTFYSDDKKAMASLEKFTSQKDVSEALYKCCIKK